jgi:3',5'-cyclic AMP phosphodiesterase CpdA
VPEPRLLAISDLHVGHSRNGEIVQRLAPTSDGDWLIVAGDISNSIEKIEQTLSMLAGRFARVLWVPGNHDLWTWGSDPGDVRGEVRYLELVDRCRALGVRTPEDPYEVWSGLGGPVTLVPMFLLYDYSFGRAVAPTKAEALRLAEQARVVCADEALLDPTPFSSREEWCEARVAQTAHRLDGLADDVETVLINHWPLHRRPTTLLRHQEFAQWCGTTLTEDWHLRYRARAVIYGHLHIPISMSIDGVPFHEVSLGYPREWEQRRMQREPLREVLVNAYTEMGHER